MQTTSTRIPRSRINRYFLALNPYAMRSPFGRHQTFAL